MWKRPPTREMNEDEFSIFLTLEKLDDVDGLFTELAKKTWVLKAIEKRCAAYSMNVDKKVMIAILTIGDGVVGKCAKCVDDIFEWSHMNQHKNITWITFCQTIYPTGVPIF